MTKQETALVDALIDKYAEAIDYCKTHNLHDALEFVCDNHLYLGLCHAAFNCRSFWYDDFEMIQQLTFFADMHKLYEHSKSGFYYFEPPRKATNERDLILALESRLLLLVIIKNCKP